MIAFLFQFFWIVFSGPVKVNCGSVLDIPGVYALRADCSGAGEWLLDVRTDNVSIDLAGHELRCYSKHSSASSMTGIKAVYANNLRVSNGRILGCAIALDAGHGGAVTVKNLRIQDGISIGLKLGGSDNQVLDSHFENLGLEAPAPPIAILGVGSRSIIAGNTIKNVKWQKSGILTQREGGVGILVSNDSKGVLLLNNKITLDTSNGSDLPIWVAHRAMVFLKENEFDGYRREIGFAPSAEILFSKPHKD